MPLTKLLSLFLSFCLILEQPVFAQAIDLSHYFARNPTQTISHSDKFRPLHLRYISYDNQANDFKILLDKGDFFNQKTERTLELEQTTQELMKYFFIGLSLPNEKFWVNLRPDSPDNILDPELEKTDIGRIFLEADLQLKKDTSGMTSPQTPEGKAYWDKLYKKAGELFGSENITIPTITRPWIVPNEIIIREAPDNAYIYKATLKVMLEEDYLIGRGGSRTAPTYQQSAFSDPRLKELNEYSTQLIRETIIPKLTYAVNTSKRYAQLRQVYYSLILAQWFKHKYGSPGSIRATGISAPVNSYVDQIDSGNLANLTSKEPYDKQTYFQQYQKSFQDGEYNLQEPVYTPMGQSIRRYVSGGLVVSSAIIEKATTIIPANGEPPFTGYLSSASPILLNSQIATNTPLQRLAQNELKYSMLVKQYRLTIQKIEQEIKKVYVMDGSGYEDSLSVGARAAAKLKVLELLIDLIEGKSKEDINIVNLVVYDFLPTLQEHIYGAFLPIGTEVEIWAEGPHTKYGDPNYYDDNLAREIWTEVLDLPLGYDELIEFALPPSRSSLSQVAMIDSMINIGLLPEGCFSLHISGGLPVDINVKDTVLEIASYFELAKALLYTSDKRIKYFASMWNPLAIKGTDSDVSKIEGKAPSFAIYNGEEMVRVEYRSGDVVVAGDDVFSDYRKAITFIQITHGLMVLALTAAIAPQEIKNKFLQELLKTFDDFIREMDIWKEKIPEKYAGIKDLFGRSLTTRSSSENMKHIVDFRNEEEALFKELEAVADNLRENLLVVFADVEKNSILPATESVENLEIVKRIKAALPKEVRLGDMAKVFAPAGYDNYLQDISSLGGRLSAGGRDISMLIPLIIGNLPERSSPFSYYQRNKDVLRNYLLGFNKRYEELLERSAPLFISPQLVILDKLELKPMDLTLKITLLDSLVYRFRRLMNRLIFWRNRSEGEASLKEIAKQNHLVAKGPHSNNDNKNRLSSSSVELHDDKAKSQFASSAVEKYYVNGGEYKIISDPNHLLTSGGALTCVLVMFTDENNVTALMHVQSDTDFKNRAPVILRLMKAQGAKSEEIKGVIITSGAFYPQTLLDVKDNLRKLKIPFKEFYDPSKSGAKVTVNVKGKIIEGELIGVESIPEGPLTFEKPPPYAGIGPDILTNRSSSALQQTGFDRATLSDKGGIAFNALPIQTESVASSALGVLSGGRAFIGDLDAEWTRIQDVFNAGIRPSIQRLSEYTAAAVASPLAEDKIDQVRVMLADILRRDEENEKLSPAEESCKQLLRAIEAG